MAGRRAPARGASSAVSWQAATPAPVVLVTGGEALLAERAVERVRRLARAEHPDLEVVQIEAATCSSGQLALWTSPSLFGEPRLVVVSGVEAASDALVADATAALGDLQDDVVLVLRHGGGQRAKGLLDAVRALPGAVVVDCPPVKSAADQRSFVEAEFRAAGRSVTPSALEALLLAVGQDLRSLAAACAQLVADVPEHDERGRRVPVDEADVDRYYGGRAEVTGFRVADAAVAGQREEALRLLRQALDAGLDPVPLVAAIAAKLRAMVKVGAAGRGPDHELARQLGMAPWQVGRARSDLRGWSPDGLATGIIALADADAAVKGGGRDPVYAVERAVLAITAARG
ncbi:DNA polymerase III subunit delta [Quadrisphaera sp. DSM 44207]|uniref:DNA polymerase III subunit delta n=1 Tax=Quadrisphaera sp. DSM 44207 TaxID=1881057 RepID=UPI000891A547|nr:DNA polymerase III subunit delta [Quadrisphaera sp. DSM 44207]SDQ04969.1 DNA polymerase III, delta subunit [Quadrisphaera sp. DSM 44207]